MSYRMKVVIVSLGALLLLGLLFSFNNPYGEGYTLSFGDFGVITLLVSIFEGLGLFLIAIVVRLAKIGGQDNYVGQEINTLDAPEISDRVAVGYIERAKAFALAGGLVLLVGASLCYGSLAV